MPMPTKQLLIIGAGPHGLAVAGYAKHLGIDFAMSGKPMEFWRNQMPKGMLLRSGGTWHLLSLSPEFKSLSQGMGNSSGQ
ncbi:MAG TPA: hypothetical protein VKO18_19340 [Terriglobia bacterium]|nr:hypothetical protein [Terriglobia bacterium]